jgi:hypothetical protein
MHPSRVANNNIFSCINITTVFDLSICVIRTLLSVLEKLLVVVGLLFSVISANKFIINDTTIESLVWHIT